MTDRPDPRHERIRAARGGAAARAPDREGELRRKRECLKRDLAATDPESAQRIVSEAAMAADARYLGPDSTPIEWKSAVTIVRDVTIDAARRGETITCAAIRLAVLRDTAMLIGYSMFGRLVMETNRKDDRVLISSIVVKKDSGLPGSGFLAYARSQGFDEPLATIQRHVFERFFG